MSKYHKYPRWVASRGKTPMATSAATTHGNFARITLARPTRAYLWATRVACAAGAFDLRARFGPALWPFLSMVWSALRLLFSSFAFTRARNVQKRLLAFCWYVLTLLLAHVYLLCIGCSVSKVTAISVTQANQYADLAGDQPGLN